MNTQYIGKQTRLAIDNFPYSIHTVQKELLYAVCEIKKAAALAHKETGELDVVVCEAIVTACDELLKGNFDSAFVLPALQGGAGTSINTNINEILAIRATEILSRFGNKTVVTANDHINMSQSTNDVNPSALKLAIIRLGKILLNHIDESLRVFDEIAKNNRDVLKLGRTHLQDAVPITVGQEFASYSAILSRDKKRIEHTLLYCHELNLGGTAVGNCVNASDEYRKAVYQSLSRLTGITFTEVSNLMSQTSSQTDFCHISQAVTLLCLDLSKIASDLRLLSSGPKGGFSELSLKELQAGSTIMPGKVNPVLPETVNQLYFLVSGNNLTIEHAAHGSQLELGIMFPIIADCLIESLKITDEVLVSFTKNCLAHIQVNEKKCKEHLEASTAYATLLTPVLGYDVVSTIVKESISCGKSIRELILEKNLIPESKLDGLLHGENT